MTTTTPPPAASAAPLTPRSTVGRIDTVPNLVTLARTGTALLLGCFGVATANVSLLVLAFTAYWIGDVADGWLARRLGQETRFGAVLDVVCDRACTVLLCAGLLTVLPGAAPVVVVFLACFAVLDTMLTLAFLAWPIDSPNDFWRVDRLVFAWNWSPLAKSVTTAGVVLAVALGQTLLALVVALAVVAVKLWSARRVLRMLA